MSKPDTQRFYPRRSYTHADFESAALSVLGVNHYRQEMAKRDAQRARTVDQLLGELAQAVKVLDFAWMRRTERLAAVSR